MTDEAKDVNAAHAEALREERLTIDTPYQERLRKVLDRFQRCFDNNNKDEKN
jgi:hypothetical protein